MSIDIRTVAATLRGRVVASGESPWRGVVVAVPWPPTESLATFSRLAVARTGEDGRFTLGGLAEGAVVVGAVEDGALLALGPAVTLPSAAEYVLRLDGGAFRASGRVVADADGSPIAGAVVQSVFRPGRPAPDVVIERAVTGADGRFSVVPPPEGSLRAAARGFAPEETRIGEDGADVEIRLARGATVSGTVTSEEDGAPVAGVTVRGLPGDYWAGLLTHASASTDAEGRYSLGDLPAGTVTVYVLDSAWVSRGLVETRARHGPLSVELAAGASARLDLVVERMARVEGRVTDAAGRPVAGATVSAAWSRAPRGRHPLQSWAKGPRTLSGNDGRYALDPLLPGIPYALSAASGDSATAQESVPALPPGGTRTVDLRFAAQHALEVLVVEDRPGARPIPGASVQAFEDRFAAGDEVVTDADGRARLDPAPPGTRGVQARAGGWSSSGIVPVRFEGDTSPEPVCVRIALRRGLSIAGHVRMPDGSPASGAMIRAAGHVVTVGPDGTFVLSGLEVGARDLHAGLIQAAKTYIGFSRADAGASDVEITLQPKPPPRTVRVRVQDPAGKPVPVVTLSTASERSGYWSEIYDDDRKALGPGEWLVTMEDGDRWIAAADPATEEEEPLPFGWALSGPLADPSSEVTIRLPAEVAIGGRVLGPDGKGLAGLTVDASPFSVEAGGRIDIGWSSSAETDSEGAFHLGHMAAGEYEVSVTAPKGMLAPPPVRVVAGRKDMDLRLAHAHRIRGRVRDPEGKPVSRAIAFRRAESDGEEEWPSAVADDAGAFVLYGVPAGPVVLRASPPGGDVEEAEASEITVAHDAKEVVLVTDPGVDLVVRLTGSEEDRGGGYAFLLVEGAGDAPPARRTLPVGGIARFEHVPRGRTYEFWAGRRDGSCAYVREIRAESGEVSVAFGPGLAVAGKLTVPSAPLREFVVYAESRGRIFVEGTSDTAGRYVISGLPPGRCVVHAHGSLRGVRWSFEREVDAGDTLDFELKPE